MSASDSPMPPAHDAAVAQPSPSPVDAKARELIAELRAAIDANTSGVMTQETLEDLFAALIHLYGTNAEQCHKITPLKTDRHTNATAILMTVTALLRGANLELFELGMWQSWSGMK